MKSLTPRARRFLLRMLSRRRGSVRAIRDLTYLTEVLRFSSLFTLLVLFPVLLLAMLAFRSLQAEEVLIDAGLEERADAIATQVQSGLRSMFEDFEQDVRDNIRDGDMSMQSLDATGLRAVFRFDADGELVSPFALPTEAQRWEAAPADYDRTWRRARQAEADGRWEEAIQAYEEAATLGSRVDHEAESRLAAARARWRAGDPRSADALTFVASEYPQARDRRTVRVADAANLLRAQIAEEAGDTEQAARLLRGVLERSLAAAWYVGLSGDAFVAHQALGRLGPTLDPSVYRIAAARLQERTQGLHWATEIEDELRLVAGRARLEQEFQYHAEERTLWATVRALDNTWAFSFDDQVVLRDLERRVVDVAGKVDPDLKATLVRSRDDISGALVRLSLAPELARAAVIVSPADPAALAAQRARTRAQRMLVILLAVAAASLGMFAAVRTVNRELEGARQKADFAANVSHELRSPITQIRLKGESLQLDLVFDEADRQAHYDAIVREAERLSRLVDNVLDFSSIERGVKKYTLRPDDVGEVVRKAVDATAAAAAGQRLKLVVDVPDDLPVVWIDREAISQVMTNLLSNAIKYGADGEQVEVVARVGLDGLDVSIRDQGFGIQLEDQSKIFEHFYRVQSADVRKRRGTGIGLTIVRYIVEAHGGSIAVESQPGQGSTFTVTLPLEPPQGAGG